MKGRSILAMAMAVFLAVLLGFAVWGIRYTNSPNFCDSCHIVKPFVETWQKSPMGRSGVTCVDCHFEPGVMGYVRGKVYSFIKLVEYGVRDFDRPPSSTALLTNSSCLACHGDTRDPKYPGARGVVSPEDPTYPQIAVTDQYGGGATINFPHDFHVNTAQLHCADCHSAVIHGTELIPDKPQAKATPEFCGSCHSGDIAPILFGPLKLSGREHPGVPKIDTGIWRNNHWKLAKGPGEIDGMRYEKIEKQTCLACHKEPTEAKNCKSCHFPSEPMYAPTLETQDASRAPLAMFVLVVAVWSITLFPEKVRRFFFEGWIAALLGAVVFASDLYAMYRVFAAVAETTEGGRSIGPTTLWLAYIFAGTSLMVLLFHQGVLRPRRRRLSKHGRV